MISACMTVSVRELRTAVREWACCFVILYLESIVFNFAPCKISMFQVVSVAEQAGLSLTWSESTRTGLLISRPI